MMGTLTTTFGPILASARASSTISPPQRNRLQADRAVHDAKISDTPRAGRPVLATWVGLVVTPSMIPQL